MNHDDTATTSAAGAQRVRAATFHPMLGHVAAGVQVELSNQRVLEVKPTMRGWTLFDMRTQQRIAPEDCDASTLTAWVVDADNASQYELNVRTTIAALNDALAPLGYEAEFDLGQVWFSDASGEPVELDDLPADVRAIVARIDPRAAA